MSRRMEAPVDFTCPYRHACPHLDGLSTTWTMEEYQEADVLRGRYHAMEERYLQRIAELEQALRERDDKIAQLRLQHQKQFKANVKVVPLTRERGRRRPGAPQGHPPWRRREPDHVDETVNIPAPQVCPRCQCRELSACREVYEHVQEDIVLVPRTRVVRFRHRQSYCPKCRRPVYQTAGEEVAGCCIGPVTRAVAMHLRYDLQIPYRKVQHILRDLFGMPLATASAMSFDRQATMRGLGLYEELGAKLKSADVAHADETSWRENGRNRYLWFGGNRQLAVYQIADRSSDSAVALLGADFDGSLVTDALASYNAVKARYRQTCWSHLGRRSREILQQIKMIDPPIRAPKAVAFCRRLEELASRCCELGRQLRARRITQAQARAMIPSLEEHVRWFAGKPVDHEAAETLRDRIIRKDFDKLFTFLRVKGVEPTNNHAEQSVRPAVIMRKISFGTRSQAGSRSHCVLPSLLQTARRQGKDPVAFLVTLLTRPQTTARKALFTGAG